VFSKQCVHDTFFFTSANIAKVLRTNNTFANKCSLCATLYPDGETNIFLPAPQFYCPAFPDPYAKWGFLHTNCLKNDRLYAKQAILHTNQLKTGHLYAKTPVLHTDWEENHQTVENLGRDTAHFYTFV
jgi:hypothetical protein